MKKLMFTASMAALVFFACKQQLEKPTIPSANTDLESSLAPCDPNLFTYSGQVKPIMSLNCTSSRCHDNIRPAAGINLTVYTGVKKVALNGRLWGAVNHSNGFVAMPRGAPKLSACNLMQIQKWITAGALNN